MLVSHIERYRDDDIEQEIEDAIAEYRSELNQAAQLMRSRHASELAELDQQRDAIRERFAEVRIAAYASRAAIADPAQAAYEAIVLPARATYDAIVADAQSDLDAIVNETQDGLAASIERADDACDEIIEDARGEIADMEGPFVAQAQALISQINAEFDEAVPGPDDFNWPQPEADEWESPLFDSTRGYIEQVDVYRSHRGKVDDVRLAADRIVTKTCARCGASFESANVRQEFCGKRCANSARKQRYREALTLAKERDDTGQDSP
jgi:hypothetical protein